MPGGYSTVYTMEYDVVGHDVRTFLIRDVPNGEGASHGLPGTDYPIPDPRLVPQGNQSHKTWCFHRKTHRTVQGVSHERHHGNERTPRHTPWTALLLGVYLATCFRDQTRANVLTLSVEHDMDGTTLYMPWTRFFL